MTIKRRPVSEPKVLNEAYQYSDPVPFSRAFRLDIKGVTVLLISGTASVDEKGDTIHMGDIEAQTKRMLENVTALLARENATWHDVVRTTFYHRDIDRDYQDVSRIRTEFFQEIGLQQYPASTGIEAKLCRSDLLIEMEAIAIYESDAEK
ncbi:MAG: Rid family hydrolase [Candidatus Lernaella stagnicola]|nr:Rid family hydrolase [Candidatus Lernaella stagnicola]